MDAETFVDLAATVEWPADENDLLLRLIDLWARSTWLMVDGLEPVFPLELEAAACADGWPPPAPVKKEIRH